MDARIQRRQKIIKMINDGISINNISKTLGIAKSTIYYHYYKIKGRRYSLAVIPKNDKIIGEFLGAFAGDGSYFFDKKTGHHRISIHLNGCDDIEYAMYLKYLIEKNFNKKVCMTIYKETQLTLKFYSRKIYDLIEDTLEIKDDKTFNVCLKNSLGEFSNNFLKFFVRGLFDTDGHVAPYCLVLKCISKNLIKQTSIILNRFGIANDFRIARDKRINCRDCYIVIVKKNQMPRFLSIIGLSNTRKLMALKKACGSGDLNPD